LNAAIAAAACPLIHHATMFELLQDVGHGLRMLRQGRGIAVAVVLALGVGVNLAVFSVIHAVLLRPLPHPDPDRLVAVSSLNVRGRSGSGWRSERRVRTRSDARRAQASCRRVSDWRQACRSRLVPATSRVTSSLV
jgi:hypothetical protein